MHMYTVTGIDNLVEHLRSRCPVILYHDATGGLLAKLPNQSKRILDYLPSLPVGALQLSRYTQLQIHQIETDYSWALMQSVLLTFNRENITTYLDRAYAVCTGEKEMRK